MYSILGRNERRKVELKSDSVIAILLILVNARGKLAGNEQFLAGQASKLCVINRTIRGETQFTLLIMLTVLLPGDSFDSNATVIGPGLELETPTTLKANRAGLLGTLNNAYWLEGAKKRVTITL